MEVEVWIPHFNTPSGQSTVPCWTKNNINLLWSLCGLQTFWVWTLVFDLYFWFFCFSTRVLDRFWSFPCVRVFWCDILFCMYLLCFIVLCSTSCLCLVSRSFVIDFIVSCAVTPALFTFSLCPLWLLTCVLLPRCSVSSFPSVLVRTPVCASVCAVSPYSTWSCCFLAVCCVALSSVPVELVCVFVCFLAVRVVYSFKNCDKKCHCSPERIY